jgi:hypothetical protein
MTMTRAERNRQWRIDNPERRREINLEAAQRVRARNRALIVAAKSVPCVDCGGVFHTECMDFDHRDGESKKRGVGLMTDVSEAMLLAEMAKCDVVCANCHRFRTYSRRSTASAEL